MCIYCSKVNHKGCKLVYVRKTKMRKREQLEDYETELKSLADAWERRIDENVWQSFDENSVREIRETLISQFNERIENEQKECNIEEEIIEKDACTRRRKIEEEEETLLQETRDETAKKRQLLENTLRDLLHTINSLLTF